MFSYLRPCQGCHKREKVFYGWQAVSLIFILKRRRNLLVGNYLLAVLEDDAGFSK